MGINMNSAFPSKWLKSDDIQQPTPVTFRNVTMEEVGDGEHKPVAWFNEFDKAMVLNKTNANNTSALYGPDSDGWIGRQMLLTTAMVDFQGRSTRALRLYAPGSIHQQQAPQSPAQMTNAPLGQGDPRGDVPSAMSENEYGAQRG